MPPALDRRQFCVRTRRAAGAWLAWAVCGCAAARPGYTVSAEQLEQALAQRFPLRYPVARLFDVDLQAPRLRLLPQQNRLGSELTLAVGGPALRRSYGGVLDLDFALRYEPADRSIRAHQLRLHALRVDGLPAEATALLDSYLPMLAADRLGEVVLHRLRPRDLELADNLGLQPGAITVTDRGLQIGFVPKPLR